jgi:hypothetical protein
MSATPPISPNTFGVVSRCAKTANLSNAALVDAVRLAPAEDSTGSFFASAAENKRRQPADRPSRLERGATFPSSRKDQGTDPKPRYALLNQ